MRIILSESHICMSCSEENFLVRTSELQAGISCSAREPIMLGAINPSWSALEEMVRADKGRRSYCPFDSTVHQH